MNSYIINFSVYSFAMIGFFLTVIYIYKKSSNYSGLSGKKDFLKVQNMLKLTPSKAVYVIKAGNEKFLIAGDPANTTMLAKLESTESIEENDIPEKENTAEIPLLKAVNMLKEKAFGLKQCSKCSIDSENSGEICINN